MPFTRPKLSEIVDRIDSDFLSRITDSGLLLRRSVLNIIARVYAGAVHLLYGFLDFQSKQLFATTADSTGLDIIGNEFGIARDSASKAIGGGTSTGTNGITAPAGSVLISGDGNRYLTDADATIETGSTLLTYTAETANSDSNDIAGITLTFVNPIAGINTNVTVDSSGITDGDDAETDDDYRERILQRKRQAPHGGAEFDYEVWAKEVAGVTRAWSLPLFNGIGTIGLTFVRDNDTSIIPSASELTEVEDYIISHDDPATGKQVGIPVTAQPGLFVFAPTELEVDFEIQIDPNSASVQNSVTNELIDLILRDGGAGQTLRLSRISEAISLATGEIRHVLDSPVADVTATTQQVHVLGTITFTTLT